MTIKQIFNSTREMRPAEKVKLVNMILTDLDKPDLSIESEWVEEIHRRKDSIKNGKTKLLSYQQVMGKYK